MLDGQGGQENARVLRRRRRRRPRDQGPQLGRRRRRDQGRDRRVARVTTEDLLAYESPAQSAADFDTSLAAWRATLTSLGVVPNDAVLRAYLEEGRGSFSRAPQRDEVANYEEVSEILREAGPPYSTMLHE